MKLFFLTGLLGALCGVTFLSSWTLGLCSLMALTLSAFLIHQPVLCWAVLFGASLVISNYVPPLVSSVLFWGALILFSTACWLEQRRERRPIDFLDRGLWGAVGVWFLWTLVSMLGSLDRMESLKEIGRHFLSFGFLLVLLNWLRSKNRITQTLRWVEGFTLILAVLCVLQLLIDPKGHHLLGPYFPSPLEWGDYFAAMIPINVSLLLVSRKSSRWPQWLALLLMGIGLLYTEARSAYLAAFMGLSFLFWKTSRRWFARTFLLALAGIGALFLLFSLQYGNIAKGFVENLSGRPLLWKAALKALWENPWLGIGPGCWDVWFHRHFVTMDFFFYDRMGNSWALTPTLLGGEAHNLFLTQAAEMGLPVLAFIAVLFAAWYRVAKRSIQNLPSGWWRALGVGSLSSMFGLLFICLLENGPIIGRARGGEIILVWWIAALPLVIGRLFRQSHENLPA